MLTIILCLFVSLWNNPKRKVIPVHPLNLATYNVSNYCTGTRIRREDVGSEVKHPLWEDEEQILGRQAMRTHKPSSLSGSLEIRIRFSKAMPPGTEH
jgi:hypothetical protein